MGLLTDILRDKIREHHADEDKRRDLLLNYHMGLAHQPEPFSADPNEDKQIREYHSGEALKMMSPDARKRYNKAVGLMGVFNQLGHNDNGQTLQIPIQGLASPTDTAISDKAPDNGVGPNIDIGAGPAPNKPAAPVAPVNGLAPPKFMTPTNPESVTNRQVNPRNLGVANASSLAQAGIMQAARKKQAQDIGLKPGSPEYNKFVALGQFPNQIRPTTAASKHAQLVESFMDANPGMTEPEAEHLAGQRELEQKQAIVEIETTDGKRIPARQSPAGLFTNLDNSPIDPNTIKGVIRPSNAAIRVNAQEAITLAQAAALENSGAKLNIVDASGQPIERSSVPAGMVLQAVHQGQNTVYTPRAVADRTVKFNNQVVAVSPYEEQQIPAGAGTVLGVSNVGTSTSSTPTVVQRDAQGVPHVLGSTSVRTPNTLPARNPLIPTDFPPAKTAPPAAGATSQKQARTAAGVLPSMDKAAVDVARPLNEASTQLFGDPQNPAFKPLVSYEKLADDPGARARIGRALQLTFAGIEQAAGGRGASVSGGVGPVSVNSGGFGTWLQNAFGIPQKNAEAVQRIREEAIAPLKPEEREAVNAIVDAFSAIPAIRSVTKGVATQATIEALERDVPAIGYNTMDSKTFRDKMGRLAEYFYQGRKFLPSDSYVSTENIDAYLGRKASPKGKLNAPPTKIDELRKKYQY